MATRNSEGRDISFIVFLAALLLVVSLVSMVIGMHAVMTQNLIFNATRQFVSLVYEVVDEVAKRANFDEPTDFMQPSRHEGAGVTVNARPEDGSLVFMSGFFDGSNEIRLIHRDGTIVRRWPVRLSEHFPDLSYLERPPLTDRNVDLHGALINPDGSVVFNYEYTGLVKLSRCGEVEWTLRHPTHHSVEVAEGGGYWVAGRTYFRRGTVPGFPPFTRYGPPRYLEDLILKVDEDGNIVTQVSVPRILYESGLEPLLTATGYDISEGGYWNEELVHLNKIGELPAAFADAFDRFETGDLLLSLRTHNLVLVVGQENWRVKWYQAGPWIRQHDPEFNTDGTISVFNNNTYRLDLDRFDRAKPGLPLVSNIVKVDPATSETEIVYGGRADQEMLTVLRGKHQPLADGGFLITEFEGGRVLEVKKDGNIVWEYINRLDDDWVLEISEARLYPEEYFSVESWSCAD